jgi:type II secretory pathway pseudopilin PulG
LWYYSRMNNDFNYRPNQSRSDQSSDSSESERKSADKIEQDAPVAQPMGKVITSPRGSGAGKKFLTFLLVLILIAAAAGGVYYWQQKKVNDAAASQSAAQKQVASLQSQLAKQKTDSAQKTTAAATIITEVITGEPYAKAVGTASISVLYLPGEVSDIWLEYGTAPDKLDKTSNHITQGLGEGQAGSYGNQGFVIQNLSTGRNYFYRAAAKTKAGTTIYGGIASFAAQK